MIVTLHLQSYERHPEFAPAHRGSEHVRTALTATYAYTDHNEVTRTIDVFRYRWDHDTPPGQITLDVPSIYTLEDALTNYFVDHT